MATLGTRLRKVREENDLRQKDVATRADISVTFVSDIENDKRNVSSEVLMRLSNALGVTMHWLMTGERWSGELPDKPLEIPPHLEAVAAKERWTFNEATDMLAAVRCVHKKGSSYKPPEDLSPNDWLQLRSALDRIVEY